MFLLGALIAVGLSASAAPQQAHASETGSTQLLTLGSIDGNTTFNKAMELSLGQSYTGTFDYAVGTNSFEDYWFKFKTSDRHSQYEVQIDSIDGKRIATRVFRSDGKIDTSHWKNTNGSNTDSRTTWYRSDADINTWFYVKIMHNSALRYQQYRIEVRERGTLAATNVSLSQNEYTYSGSACTPRVTATCNGRVLSEGADYEVSYKNNVEAGTGKVTVTGLDGYVGTVTKEFTINKKPVATPTGRTLTYNGQEQRGVSAGANYTVSNNVKIDAGNYTASAKLPSRNNYQWSDGTSWNKYISWKILPANQKLKTTNKTVKVKAKKLKRASVTINASKVTRGVSAENYIRYSKVKVNKGASRFNVLSNGSICIASKTKKGTYKITVRATASSSKNYKTASRNFVVTVVVK